MKPGALCPTDRCSLNSFNHSVDEIEFNALPIADRGYSMLARSVSSLGVFVLLLGGQAFAQLPIASLSPYDAEQSQAPDPKTSGVWPTEFRQEQRPPFGVVSVRQLEHKVPRKAQREYDRSEKARRHNDVRGAIAHLEKAVKIDPEFVAARNNLGANYLLVGKADAAVVQLQECVNLDPHNYMPESNLALALMIQKKFEDAERSARRGVSLDHTGTRTRLILAMSLLMQDKFTPEAMEMLKRAARDYPQATLLSARVYAAHGQFNEARQAIETYLQKGEAAGRPLANTWLRMVAKAEADQRTMASAHAVH